MMLDKIKRGIFPTIIALSALSVSGSAAFYSVSGLSKLFAGASTEVIIMTGSLEIAKLVIASLLYQYWDDLNKILRTYLTVAAGILMIITSIGIYGFLSSAYQASYKGYIISTNQIQFLEEKAKFYENDIARYDDQLKSTLDNINSYSKAKATQVDIKGKDGVFRNGVSTIELSLAQKRIQAEEVNKTEIQKKREDASTNLQKYKLEILELQNNTKTSGELGPLQYLSNLTGLGMDKIVNLLLLIIIFVFDPLAISLVLAANFAFNQIKPKKNLYGEDVYGDSTLPAKRDTQESILFEKVEEPPIMNPISLEELEQERSATQDDWEVVTEDDEPYSPNVFTRVLQQTPSKRRVLKEDGTEQWIDKKDILRYL